MNFLVFFGLKTLGEFAQVQERENKYNQLLEVKDINGMKEFDVIWCKRPVFPHTIEQEHKNYMDFPYHHFALYKMNNTIFITQYGDKEGNTNNGITDKEWKEENMNNIIKVGKYHVPDIKTRIERLFVSGRFTSENYSIISNNCEDFIRALLGIGWVGSQSYMFQMTLLQNMEEVADRMMQSRKLSRNRTF